MAVKLITHSPRYIGTAAERAAMDTTNVPVGASFLESDTGNLYILGETGWIVKAQETSLNAIQAAVESYPTGATPWTSTDVSAANTAKTITKAAVAGKSHYITAIEVSTKGADAASDIDVVLNEDNAGTPVAKWQEVIGTYAVSGSRCGIVFAKPIKLTAGKTADLVVDAGGASVVTVLNLQGFTL